MRSFFAFTLAAMVALPLSAAAKPVLYDCDITQKNRKSNWIPEKVLFVIADDGSVQVVDQNVLYFNEAPMQAKVGKRKDGLKLNWLLTGIKSITGQPMPPAKYRAELNTSARSVKVYATSSAFSGARVWGTGGCKVQTNGRLPKVFR